LSQSIHPTTPKAQEAKAAHILQGGMPTAKALGAVTHDALASPSRTPFETEQ
jgi:hypothetical protein